jgi:8-oxo-dGTP pyrophosphatase MutT (NUDIX family)
MEDKRPFDPSGRVRQIRTRQGMQDYLDVKFRVLWLRAEHPDASIVTEAIYANETEALMKATVSYYLGDRVVLATGHGSETAADFPGGHIEKAETKAIGRACAVLGYGTDSAADFDDGEPMDGRAAAKDERATRRMEPEERGKVDAQHAANVAPQTAPPSRLPTTRRPPQQQAAPAPKPGDDGRSNVHQHAQLRTLAEHGFDVTAGVHRFGLAAIEELSVQQAKELIIEGRAAVRNKQQP